MYSIGEFSRITGLTIKAVHLYHEKGLLIPGAVDEETGYRYFNQRDAEKAHAIFLLKEMMFSLSEIGELLRDYDDESEIVSFLERKRSQIETKLRQLKSVSTSIDRIIANEKEITTMSSQNEFQITEKEAPRVLVAAIRWKGKYGDSGKAFAKLGKAVGMRMAGKPMGLYYDMEYKEDGADIESCFPVKQKVEAEGISSRELPGGKCITLIHKGPYDQLSRSYGKIFEYLKQKHYTAISPIREVYLKGPGMIFKGNPKKYLTEIQIFV
jgi:DNA-binding transcriptional MerR regulator/DNA gyrase inhibitor GyrI